MTKEESYGILLYKRVGDETHVFLIKPNGPGFWHHNSWMWSIPKGHREAGETPQQTAHREFREETGVEAPRSDDYILLTPFHTRRGKKIAIFAQEVPTDTNIVWKSSNSAEVEWPPKSGNVITYAETIAGGWFPLKHATKFLVDTGYGQLLNNLDRILKQRRVATATLPDPVDPAKPAQ